MDSSHPQDAVAASSSGVPGSADPISDQELDRYILTRLALVGVDLDVLPEDDSAAPADRSRILRSVRRLLRDTVPYLSAYRLENEEIPAVMYPAHLPPVGLVGDGGAEG